MLLYLILDGPRTTWSNYNEISRNREQWLNSLKPHKSDPAAYIARHVDSSAVTIYEAVVVFRLQDISVSCVMLDNQDYQKEQDRWPLPPTIARAHKRRTVLAAFDGEQRSLTSNTLLASDTEMHKLKANLISIDITQYYTFDILHVGEFN